MTRLVIAGGVGGVVLLLWSVVFHTFGPVSEGVGPGATFGSSLRTTLESAGVPIPLGPATASAADAVPAAVSAGPALAVLDLGRGLLVACIAATAAAMLMSWSGGDKKPFVDRLVFAAILGSFCAAAMMVPEGRWANISVANAAPVFGEVLVGWLLAGMVIAVAMNPRKPKRASP